MAKGNAKAQGEGVCDLIGKKAWHLEEGTKNYPN
jgi:hypothetical protein